MTKRLIEQIQDSLRNFTSEVGGVRMNWNLVNIVLTSVVAIVAVWTGDLVLGVLAAGWSVSNAIYATRS